MEKSANKDNIEGLIIKNLLEKEENFDIHSKNIRDLYSKVIDSSNEKRENTSLIFRVKGRDIRGLNQLPSKNKESEIAATFGEISTELLNNLYSNKKRKHALLIIRSLYDMSDDTLYTTKKESSDTINKLFFTRINQIFYHSKRLLNVATSPELASKYLKLYHKNDLDTRKEIFSSHQEIGKVNDDRISGILIKKQTYEFSSQNFGESFHMAMNSKSDGIHFGGYVEFFQKKFPHSFINYKKYFLKSFNWYPARNNKGSNETIEDTISSQQTSTDPIQGGNEEIKIGRLDLKEPFMYKVLEILNLGPNTDLIINPYIKNGLFIVTEDITSNESEFILAQDWNLNVVKEYSDAVNTKLSDLKKILKDSKISYRNNNIESLTEISLVSSIFKLTDMKPDNFGFLTKKK